MAKNAFGATVVGLVALGTSTLGSVPNVAIFSQPSQAQIVPGQTGLTAGDLIVGLDGTVSVDVKVDREKLAACDSSVNNKCTNVCC